MLANLESGTVGGGHRNRDIYIAIFEKWTAFAWSACCRCSGGEQAARTRHSWALGWLHGSQRGKERVMMRQSQWAYKQQQPRVHWDVKAKHLPSRASSLCSRCLCRC